VGTLHEINSETSTVALENVSSFGTESRKTDPKEVIPPSDSVYEYIVFRGSDVKDLRIEETPAARENIPPQVPNDPAILGVSLGILSKSAEPARWTQQLTCFYVMKYSDVNSYSPRAQNRVEISVAFLLILQPIYIISSGAKDRAMC